MSNVLVIPVEHSPIDFGNSRKDPKLSSLPKDDKYVLKDRAAAEEDPSFLQIIPYVVLRRRGLLFSYLRGSSGSEARLHKKRSIGIGGHIEESDIGTMGVQTIISAAWRELKEEISIHSRDLKIDPQEWRRLEPVGYIRGLATPVDRVHLGVVFVCDLQEYDEVVPSEDCISVPIWVSPTAIKDNPNFYENWALYTLQMFL